MRGWVRLSNPKRRKGEAVPVFAVVYRYTDDAAGRDEHRPAHKYFLEGLGHAGINLCSGTFAPGEQPGALILVRAASKDEALASTEQDPFRVNGLVSDVSAQEWIPMLGELAQHV